MTRAAVVGCGDVSTVHLEAIDAIDGIELVGVCDTDQGRRDAAASAHRVPGFATVTDLLDAVGPDVVHVATPHDQHVPVSETCLLAGVHVIQENPWPGRRRRGSGWWT